MIFLYVWLMGSVAKIYLSEQEQQLVYNGEWILTKRAIIERIINLFASIGVMMEESTGVEQASFSPEITSSRPKITRGENYLGLPYVILDYPAIFRTENIFAIRTMFWWGNFFSVTLHLAGAAKVELESRIVKRLLNNESGISICINEDQWQHHFQPGNYRMAAGLSLEELTTITAEKDFLKIAIKFPLQHWEQAADLILQAFDDLLKLVKT